jgi:hypothetical protein
MLKAMTIFVVVHVTMSGTFRDSGVSKRWANLTSWTILYTSMVIIGGMYVGESGSTLIINGQNSSNVAYVLWGLFTSFLT